MEGFAWCLVDAAQERVEDDGGDEKADELQRFKKEGS